MQTAKKNGDEDKSIFYKPKTLSLFVTLTNIYAWLNLIGGIAYVAYEIFSSDQQRSRLFLITNYPFAAPPPLYFRLLQDFPAIIVTTLTLISSFLLFKSMSLGLNVLIQIGFNRQATATEIKNDLKKQSSAEDQPAFYKPEQLLSLATITSIAAWLMLLIYLITGLKYFTIITGVYTEEIVEAGIIYGFFSYILNGILAFFLLKGISYTLHVLMEFEFNTRGEK
jgi:hypothetical protein